MLRNVRWFATSAKQQHLRFVPITSTVNESLYDSNTLGGVVDAVRGATPLSSTNAVPFILPVSYHRTDPLQRHFLKDSLDANGASSVTWTKVNQDSCQLPDSLKSLPASQWTFLLMSSSDSASCEGLVNQLDSYFPSSPKFGVIAAVTPFVNGYEHTLLTSEKSILEFGCIGWALPNVKVKWHLDESLWKSVGPLYKVKVARGNMLVQLESEQQNETLLPARILQESQFSSSNLACRVIRHDMNILLPVLGGDPQRGTVALQTTLPLEAGDRIQWYLNVDEIVNRSCLELQFMDQNVTIESEKGLILPISKSGLSFTQRLPMKLTVSIQ